MGRVFGVNNWNDMQLKFFVLLFFIPGFLLAQETSTAASTEAEPPVDTSVLRELGDDYQNSIKLLQNRFRIDYKVEEVTMIFFRKYGSAPVVLVQPDGSKIFQGDADGKSLFWYDSATYDMISIKNPTPGPWQAVGQILPESRVMVLSDIKLHADPLPDIIFSGEILKQTAYLTNGGEKINYAEFRDVVSLNIKLISTNNPDYNNFGADEQTIATFEDNGRGMDEAPLDGVFTGQFNLAVPDGEWLPKFYVATPMFTREQVADPIHLYPNPIKLSHLLDGGGDGYHKLVVDAEREHVDMTSLLIDGKVRFPNGDVQNFSLTEQSAEAREHLMVNYEYGVYRVKVTAYGNTVSGRDFILDVPEYTFLSEAPELAAPEPAEGQGAAVGEAGAELKDPPPIAPPVVEPPPEPEMATSTLVGLIVGINLVLIIVGGGMIWFLTRDKQPKVEETDIKIEMDEHAETPQSSNGFIANIQSKLSGLFKKKSKAAQNDEETATS